MKRPRRRRFIRVIGLLLLLGAAVNVAVAWAIAAWSVCEHTGTRSRLLRKQELPAVPLWFAEAEPAFAEAAKRLQFDFRGAGKTGLAVVTRDDRLAMLTASGWPSCSLAHLTVVDLASPAMHGRWGIPLKRSTREFRTAYLPLRPIWPGFAINTLFYAGVLWVLFSGPFALRRMIRRQRGRCPACAYPVGQSPVCTECGAAHAVRSP